jgi:hypothetical protein
MSIKIWNFITKTAPKLKNFYYLYHIGQGLGEKFGSLNINKKALKRMVTAPKG